MIFNSIRWRLQIWHGVLLLVVLTGFGIAAFRIVRDNFWRQTDAQLQEAMDSVFRPPVNGPRPPPLPPSPGQFPPPIDGFRGMLGRAVQAPNALRNLQNGYFVLWRGDGTIYRQSERAPSPIPKPAGSPAYSEVRLREQFREFHRVLPFGDVLLVGKSVASELAALERVRWSLIAAGLTIWALGLAGGWWLTSRALRIVEEISGTAEKIAAGDLSHRIPVANTGNELDRLANVLNGTFARLEHAFQQQAQFTADASHELRTPIAVVLAQAQSALARERPAAEYRETLEACVRAAQRMRKLVESLLQLARLDAEREPIRRQPVDLAEIAGECIEFIRPMAELRHIAITAQLGSAPCVGDPEQLAQIATNLFSNAVQFNRERGEIRVRTSIAGGSAHLTVSDTGEGIPADELARVFDRFYRVDKSRSRLSGRTGLGLAICKSIVDAHGGTIDAVSTPESGSTFTLTLPVSAAQSPS